MKGVVCALALVLAPVCGFMPQPATKATTALNAEMSASVPFLMKPKNLDGYVGNVDFDPLGFAESFDIRWLREAELKNGRVAMMAILGFIGPELGLIGPGAPADVYGHKNPIVAAVSVPPTAWLGLIFAAGCAETIMHKGKMTYLDMYEDGHVPGEFDADFANLLTPENTEDLKLKEITHCRLAMIAIGGMIHQAFVTGEGVFGATS